MLVVVSLAVLYAIVLLTLSFGFARLADRSNRRRSGTAVLRTISVVVAARNEEGNLPALLSSLADIDYPRDKWELIVVDDHSAIPQQVLLPENAPFHLRSLALSGESGKKAAITAGVTASSSEIIVTTDADCLVPTAWLREINESFDDPGVRMIVGGVRLSDDGTFFSHLQATEFLSVAGTGAATIGLGIPTMCNGANLAYFREAFISCGGYQGIEGVSSGDDEYLMNQIHRKWPGSVRYLYAPDAVITTKPLKSMAEFISQRLRWAGKWRRNPSAATRVIALLVLILHVNLFFIPFAAIFDLISLKVCMLLLAGRFFLESVFLLQAANFFRIKWRWFPFIVLQFVYSFYVIAVGFMSQILHPEWKGRKVATKV